MKAFKNAGGLIALAAAACWHGGAALAADAYPAKPITIIVSFAAGGNNDVRTRQLAIPVGAALGQPIVVDNRAGATGNIGHAYAVKRPPDGYTLSIGTLGPMVLNKYVYSNLAFDPEKDFVPVLLIENTPLVLVTSTSKTFMTVKDLVDAAKANPSKFNVGNVGLGGPAHLASVLFAQTAKIEVTDVPYKGGAPASTALLSGEVDYLFELPNAALPHLQSGQVRALAVTSEKRMASLPNVPTMAELGFPAVKVTNWMGLFAPRGTPPQIVQRLNTEFNAAMSDPAIRKNVDASGNVLRGGTSDDFRVFLEDERRRWAPIAKSANLKPEE